MSCPEFEEFELIAFVAGDCDKSRAEIISEHLRDCTECRRTVERHAAEKSEFLSRHSFEEYENCVGTTKKTRILRFPGAYALAAGLVLLVAGGYVVQQSVMERSGQANYRIKGKTDITVWSMSPNGTPEIRENGVYYPGDRIQLTYSSADTAHLVVLGIESSGGVQVYFPSNGSSSVPVEPGTDIPLPNSIVLDDYVGNELYVALFSENSIVTGRMVEKVQETYERNRTFQAVTEALRHYGVVESVRIQKQESPPR